MSNQFCAGEDVLVFACSGGSNVGQIANNAAKRLDQEGAGKFFCLIGVSARIDGIVAQTRLADRVICLDGCAVACAKRALDDAGIAISRYVVATDCGIEKGHHFDITPAEIEAVCQAAR